MCAAPAYLSRHGAPGDLDDLSRHRCCTFRDAGTGKVLPWKVKVDGATVELEVAPALCTNEEAVEIAAVLSGHVISMLTGLTAAVHLRAGRLVPLLTGHVADHASLFVYYGSRAAQPTRARAFIDLTVARVAHNPAYLISAEELAVAEARGRNAQRLN